MQQEVLGEMLRGRVHAIHVQRYGRPPRSTRTAGAAKAASITPSNVRLKKLNQAPCTCFVMSVCRSCTMTFVNGGLMGRYLPGNKRVSVCHVISSVVGSGFGNLWVAGRGQCFRELRLSYLVLHVPHFRRAKINGITMHYASCGNLA